ncbi:MAG: hypothetical protein ACREHF_04625 [Rhizomicrobium sp.]
MKRTEPFQTIPFPGQGTSPDAPAPAELSRAAPPSPWPPLVFAVLVAAFWVGAGLAFGWGYFGPGGLFRLDPQQYALCAFGLCVPPLLILAAAWAFTRGQALATAADNLSEATERLFAMDETATRVAARAGRAVRRELDALNAGIDGAFARLRALEGVLEKQIASLDEAGARIDVRAGSAALKLSEEREKIDTVATLLAEAGSRASETVASRTAQLASTIESAENSLRGAGQTLEAQAATFRSSAELAAEAPQAVAVELDKQARRIEAVSDAALARSEFVLGRHERHRAAMQEMLQRLKDESVQFEAAIAERQRALADSVSALNREAKQFGSVAEDADQRIGTIVKTAESRSAEVTAGFAQQLANLRAASESAQAMLGGLVQTLRDAGIGAEALIAETAAQTGKSAKALVGDAMAEGERLLRMAAQLGTQSRELKTELVEVSESLERHLVALPGVAKQEAQRVRELVQTESEAVLDFSARMLATMQARSGPRTRPAEPAATDEPAVAQSDGEGLLGLARRLTLRPPQKTRRKEPEDKAWEMRTLLTAIDEGGPGKTLQPGGAAALGALQAALSDMAIDLQALVPGKPPGEDEWRLYLQGDRSIFARRITDSIDAETVERISATYRDRPAFRQAANIYLAEFEALLARAREGDGGLLASAVLGAETGKIYLALAYALGRLS